MVTLAGPYDQPVSSYAESLWKNGHKASKNGTSSIFTPESNSAISRTPLTAVSCKLNELNKIAGKTPLL